MGSLVLTPTFEWSYAELSVDVFGYQDAQFTLPGLKPGRYDAAVELETDTGTRTIRLDPIDVLRDSERRIVVPSS
jgi:hypothetical protein